MERITYPVDGFSDEFYRMLLERKAAGEDIMTEETAQTIRQILQEREQARQAVKRMAEKYKERSV